MANPWPDASTDLVALFFGLQALSGRCDRGHYLRSWDSPSSLCSCSLQCNIHRGKYYPNHYSHFRCHWDNDRRDRNCLSPAS
ncbi:hypothetical protein BDV36DRAFT_146042 [Aspergillus pseudocaelatus]|uniref:Secreted protein n=1 Tax=Aspergillus pseudocaelatus TaxID=1825620 RepID=A0ABQ6WPE6_9EURO|nr:hypothetical protein BDV36DRAFT_146042 [Aspergillus pseudocaelatus]